MKKLFESVQLGHLQVKNRLVRSATFERLGENGLPTQALSDLYREMAEGEIGLIITGMYGVSPTGCIAAGQVRAYEEQFAEAFKPLSEMVHGYGAKIVAQLAHCGIKARWQPEGKAPEGASAMEFGGQQIREMSVEDIAELAKRFALAAQHCKEAGIDGVQIHAAHGYLISQFLSPYFNHRTDAYGGPVENRARILFEVYDAIRAAVGPEYPVMMKINSEDCVENGLTLEESTWICSELSKRGMDAIELSVGLGVNHDSHSYRIPKDVTEESYLIPAANALADKIDAAVISVGGHKTPARMEEVLNSGKVEALSMCRALMREPALAKRWKEGDISPALCTSCNLCTSSNKNKQKVFGCEAI